MWCTSTEPCAEVLGAVLGSRSCEFPFLVCEKLKRSGVRQRGNLWALLHSQALCLDRRSIPAMVPLPFPQLHTLHWETASRHNLCSGPAGRTHPHGKGMDMGKGSTTAADGCWGGGCCSILPPHTSSWALMR